MCRGLATDTPAKVKYTFKGRSEGRYVWSSDQGDICCGIKHFWNPKSPRKAIVPRLEKENVLAASLWGTNLGRDVGQIAVDQLEELERMGYTLIKKRKSNG